MRKLCEEFKHFRGQPIEIITNGMRFCGIDIDNDDQAVSIVDEEGRVVMIEYKHIDAIIEPQMRLHRLCTRHDCDCHDECDRRTFNDNDSCYDD